MHQLAARPWLSPLCFLLLFAIKRLSANGIVLVISVSMMVGIAAWYTSPYLRQRVEDIRVEIQRYEATNTRTSSGERIEFWKKSIEFVRQVTDHRAWHRIDSFAV